MTGMKKWITSNYHYMVPEFDEETKIKPDFSAFYADVQRGIDKLGAGVASPVILGPVSLVYFTKIAPGTATKASLLEKMLAPYKSLLDKLESMGVAEIQIHEPALVFAEDDLSSLLTTAYPAILPSDRTSINLVASFMDDVGEKNYEWLVAQPQFKVLSLDFTRGDTADLIKKFGFPSDKALGAGVIDSRNVWKAQPVGTMELVAMLSSHVSELRIQPSGSLQYTPWDLDCEEDLKSHPAYPVLSFAKQKLEEIRLVAQATGGDKSALKAHDNAWTTFQKKAAKESKKQWTEKDFARPEPFEERRPKQLLGVPMLPTTTIGSFPQTPEIRRLRTQMKKGVLNKAEYEAAIDKQIAYAIGLQEALGLGT